MLLCDSEERESRRSKLFLHLYVLTALFLETPANKEERASCDRVHGMGQMH